jgi:hypothetical protein
MSVGNTQLGSLHELYGEKERFMVPLLISRAEI